MTPVSAENDGFEIRYDRNFFYEWLWSCCHCQQHGPMSIDIVISCPGCSHERCTYCGVEQAKFSKNREEFPTQEFKPLSSVTLENNPGNASEEANGQISTLLDCQATSEPQNSEIEDVTLGVSDHFETSLSSSAPPVFASKKRRNMHTDQRPETTFACPYHKHDPSKYTGRVYRTCACPNIPIDRSRQLKDHLQSVHGPLYCDHCSLDFVSEKGSELLDHCKSCVGPAMYTRKGISSTQWKAITASFQEKGAPKGELKRRRDEDRWYETWNVLLPDATPPSDPYPTRPRSRFDQCEILVALFQKITQHKVRNGILSCNEDRDRVNSDTLREAYHELTNTVQIKDQCFSMEEKPESQLSWIEEINTAKSTWLSALDSFQTPDGFQNDDSYLNDLVFDMTEVPDYQQPFQKKQQFWPVVPFATSNDTYSLVPSSTSPTVEEQASWSPHSTIDPRVTLLQTKSDPLRCPG
ncbi:hypothetical protein ONS95_004738 [Cadophora gregata]|uniref:uncharacterized protein n=1 Tax=Cadophora gregata TaxID=51156 RepID=UPI0026DB3557|nr:uncharacterized protein ONS95_004738 [Cadophora gregata]KAK0104449.1 hypothetical protein ONS95_004738 [Cadophora gregata]